MSKSFFAAMALFIAMLTAAPTAQACSCAGPPDVVQSYRGADHAFAGTVLYERVIGGSISGERLFAVRVHKTVKGCTHPGEIVVLTTPVSSATCGANFTVGQTYVFMGGDAGLWQGRQKVSVNSCGYNKTLANVPARDRQYLIDRPVVCNGQFQYCANGMPQTHCLVDPCTVTASCQPNTVCEANYCTGCTAEFYDANNYAVCQPW